MPNENIEEVTASGASTSAGPTNSWNWEATKSSFDALESYNTATGDRARVDFGAQYNENLNKSLGESQRVVTVTGRSNNTNPPYYTPNQPGYKGGTPGSWNGGYPESNVSISGYDIVGIKASEIDNMTAAIKKYVDDVQNKLAECLQTNDQKLNEAIRGSQLETAVNNYINKVKTYCQNITSDLLAFSDKLVDVGNQWIEHTKKMATNIDTDTSSYAAGTAYQTTGVYQGSTGATGVAGGAGGAGGAYAANVQL